MKRTASLFLATVLAMLAALAAVPSRAETPHGAKTALLNKLREPALAAKPKDSDLRVYRLMISPTWGNLICFRVESTATGGLLVVKRLDRKGYEDGALMEKKEVALSAEEIQAFERLVEDSRYRKMTLDDPDMGLDGDTWRIEVAKAGLHHEAMRWCPNGYDPKKRGTEDYVKVFRWAADKAGVTKTITNKGHPIFDR